MGLETLNNAQWARIDPAAQTGREDHRSALASHRRHLQPILPNRMQKLLQSHWICTNLKVRGSSGLTPYNGPVRNRRGGRLLSELAMGHLKSSFDCNGHSTPTHERKSNMEE